MRASSPLNWRGLATHYLIYANMKRFHHKHKREEKKANYSTCMKVKEQKMNTNETCINIKLFYIHEK